MDQIGVADELDSVKGDPDVSLSYIWGYVILIAYNISTFRFKQSNKSVNCCMIDVNIHEKVTRCWVKKNENFLKSTNHCI